ncbi:polar amino acid ABC transporter, inner membrane subunit [Xylanimonas cellulosilytica DSM 15894]|uniref:Polar amino acid ABC transporter, inner membrane subunit n=1 Tax=Xylanimonas cellulosilytica (strain DSM 15894 / JCM 12276 / CECT 5975 / KCTC 9989 / LMG 20990 / NBRC 107835 / XIL07) TaxID=446471 RepID=D1C087_XYLCX|nr:ABC transporter permease subunit [Xylanimonas cellulosilytica]ACZ30276.1 polar amino acid ABC transporter, inner membrane subunit [Xylanimonas cellulosilytica DSM 15894]
MSNFLDLLTEYDVLGAFWLNIQLTFWGALVALAIGTVLAVMRISPLTSLRWAGTVYVDVIRNTPLTVIMTFLVLAVWTQLNVSLSSNFTQNFFNFAVVGLGVYHAAFVCESIRSGVNTVPVGQAEAARAIGLPFLAAARIVVLPQAFRGAIAPLGNTLIALLKNSTVAAAASVAGEAAGTMKTMVEFRPDYLWPVFLTFAIGFVLLVIPIGLVTTWLSGKLAVKR